MPETTQNKVDLRRKLIAARHAIASDVRQQWDAAICDRIHAWLNTHPVQTLGVYWPMRAEPDVRAIYADLTARGVQLALPIVTGKDAPLQFVPWTPGQALVKDAMGVSIPEATQTEIWPDGLLVPCVGFNSERIRLGYGGGFYDRTLATSPRPLALGIAYACCHAHFQAGPHDVAMDAIITETFCNAAD